MTDVPVRNPPVLGIDIGGSGIKGAPVDLATGELTSKRKRIPTPEKSTPENVAKVVGEIVDKFADEIGDGPIGVTIPSVVTHGRTRSAANIDKSWIDCEAEKVFADHLGRDIFLVNDGDAAGVAEVHYGAAKDHPGLVLLTTLGTGIGTAILYRGVLSPTPNSATSRSTASTPRPAPRRASRTRKACPTRSGPSACSATTTRSRR